MYRYLLILLALALFSGGCSATSAYQLMLAGDYDQAASRYAAELRADPGDARTQVLYGYALYKGGHYPEAYDTLIPQVENLHVGGYASFWAGLAALRMEDTSKLHAAWVMWRKTHVDDLETSKVMDDNKAYLFSGTLTGHAYQADEIEKAMNMAYAKDDYVRNKNAFRRSAFSEDYPYDSLVPLFPKLYLP